MAIDIRNETVIPLAEAPARTHGRPSLCTFWRWRTKGVKGRKLESFSLGGKIFTSLEALERFAQHRGGTEAPTRSAPRPRANVRSAKPSKSWPSTASNPPPRESTMPKSLIRLEEHEAIAADLRKARARMIVLVTGAVDEKSKVFAAAHVALAKLDRLLSELNAIARRSPGGRMATYCDRNPPGRTEST